MLWQRAQNDQSQLSVTSSFSTWPVFAFLGVLFGGPYLMSKFFGQSVTNSGICYSYKFVLIYY